MLDDQVRKVVYDGKDQCVAGDGPSWGDEPFKMLKNKVRKRSDHRKDQRIAGDVVFLKNPMSYKSNS